MEVAYHRFPSGKKYTYVKEKSGPTFLRNIIFLTRNDDPYTVAIVHEWGENNSRWEPPKGQMEWKELEDLNIGKNTVLSVKQLQTHMQKGILREMTEEAYILPSEIKHFKMLPLSYTQDWPESGIKGAKFMYQFWTAQITDSIMLKAQKRLKALKENKDWKHILPKDLTEKDAIEWWNNEKGFKKIRAGFSQKMTQEYYDFLIKHGVYKNA
jgi:hypothetical protein